MGTGYNPRIVTDGLVFCSDPPNPRCYSGTGTSFNDLIGGGSGSLVNNATYDNDGGGSFLTDGANEYIIKSVDFPIISAQTQGLTMSLWFKSSATPGNNVLFSYSKSGVNNGYRMQLYSGSITFVYGYVASYGLVDDDLATTGEWVNIVMSVISNKVYLYLDSVYSYARNLGTPTTTDLDTVILGGYAPSIGTSNVGGINGKFSSAYIYNRGLTADEVRQNYLATKERYA